MNEPQECTDASHLTLGFCVKCGPDKTPPIRCGTIVRSPIKSSACVAVGYDAASWTLEVEFPKRKDGSTPVFRYYPRSPEWYAELTSGLVSVGRMVHAMIRSGEVTITKIS